MSRTLSELYFKANIILHVFHITAWVHLSSPDNMGLVILTDIILYRTLRIWLSLKVLVT